MSETNEWRMVPVEPTPEMLAASEREWDGRMSARSSGVWQAMIAVAPPPPEGDEHGDIVTIAYMLGAKEERDRQAALARAGSDDRIASFLAAIMDQSPNGEIVEVSYLPTGEWYVRDRAGGDGWRSITEAPFTMADGRPAFWVLIVTSGGKVEIACREADDHWTGHHGAPIARPRRWRPLPAAPNAEGR